MEDIDITESIPKCTLVDALISKSRERTDSDFNYMSELEHFRQRVKQDIDDIKLLFPEYTPHDEQYHLKPLFHLASKLLGKRLLQELNATELFLLACALYGHDWGMAVSNSEKLNIVGGHLAKENETILGREEQSGFHKFAREHGCMINTESAIDQIPPAIWREYVRQTHTIRSARRIRKYFETIDTGVSLRLAQICESHCLDYEVLRDPIKYPVHGSVLGESANIRAIAVYLRLIDLLDFADNRTPYIIWKFVAPRDPQSVMEWNKHRALRQVTFPPYQKGQRQILVDGSTNDHEVYAALEDLKDYCEKQFRGSTDILAEMPDQRYILDLSRLTWRVEADNFRPISIQFQFDRERMLEFLSQELYQAEKYVFLRELLQNSIDAIRMRRAILQSQEKRNMKDFGEIHVRVENHSSGLIELTWTDNGIGMDQYVVQNYLAVIGKSYYRSDDFLRLGIPIDPISHFGIGILTCFMVSDSIEITTKKDCNLPPLSDALKIRIPALNRRFRVEVIPDDIVGVGTTVRLLINPMKLSLVSSPEESWVPHITNYLRRIAGFVEFPIVIDEQNDKTIIIHPYQNVEEAQKRFGHAYDIVKLNLDYPWEEAIFSEDLAIARQVFTEESFDIGKDLGLADYEGALSYPIPIDKNMDFTDGLPGHHRVTVLSGQPDLLGKSIRWMYGWNGELIRDREDSRSQSERCSCNAIYRDGILLPQASFTLPARTKISYVTPARASKLIVNLPKSRAKNVDLARNLVITDSEEWATPIFEAHGQALARKYSGEDFYRLPPGQQLFHLTSFMLFHNVSTEMLTCIFPQDDWPLPFLEQGGQLSFKRWGEMKQHTINQTPEPLSYILARLMRKILKDEELPKPLMHWSGPPSIIDFATWGGSVGDSSVISGILEFVRLPLGTSHCFGGIRFLSPPWEGSPPLLQEIWCPGRRCLSEGEIGGIIKQIAEDSAHAVYAEEETIQQKLYELIGIKHSDILRMTRFPSPFEKAFAYGNVALNLENPMARALICLAARLVAPEIQENYQPMQRKQIQWALRTVFLGLPGGLARNTYQEWKNSATELWSMARQMKLTAGLEVDNPTPQLEDFVPGSHQRFLHIKVQEGWNKPFGQELR